MSFPVSDFLLEVPRILLENYWLLAVAVLRASFSRTAAFLLASSTEQSDER